MNKLGFIIASVLLAIVVMASTLFVVDQRQFGVLYSFGQIKDVITEPGLRFKLPQPFQNVVFLDKRVLTLTVLKQVQSKPLRKRIWWWIGW